MLCIFVYRIKKLFVCIEKKSEPEELEVIDGRPIWVSATGKNQRFPTTPLDGQFPSQNDGHVKFETPKIPVVFVLGNLI